jgi:hypothetical protein
LKNSQLICGETYAYFGDRTLAGVILRSPLRLLFDFEIIRFFIRKTELVSKFEPWLP